MVEEELKELREDLEYHREMGRYLISIPINDLEKLLTTLEKNMEDK